MEYSLKFVFCKNLEKISKNIKKISKSGQNLKVTTSVEECHDIISESQHWVTRVTTSVEECYDIILES